MIVTSPSGFNACAIARMPGARTPSSLVTRIRYGTCAPGTAATAVVRRRETTTRTRGDFIAAILRFKGSRVQRFKGSGFKGSRVQGFKGSRVQGLKSSRVQEFKSSRVQEFKGARVQGCKSSRVQEFKGARVQGCKSSRVQ